VPNQLIITHIQPSPVRCHPSTLGQNYQDTKVPTCHTVKRQLGKTGWMLLCTGEAASCKCWALNHSLAGGSPTLRLNTCAGKPWLRPTACGCRRMHQQPYAAAAAAAAGPAAWRKPCRENQGSAATTCTFMIAELNHKCPLHVIEAMYAAATMAALTQTNAAAAAAAASGVGCVSSTSPSPSKSSSCQELELVC